LANPRRILAGCIGCLLLAAIAGCGRSDPLNTPTAARLRTLSTVYLNYAVANGSGPENEIMLTQQLQNALPFVLEAGGVNSLSPLSEIRSERDGEPFVIHYGVVISPPTWSEDVIAGERYGRDGNRLVAFANGDVRCVEDSETPDFIAQVEENGAEK
jgi:hypothetical protein